jgi:hypothetical protein
VSRFANPLPVKHSLQILSACLDDNNAAGDSNFLLISARAILLAGLVSRSLWKMAALVRSTCTGCREAMERAAPGAMALAMPDCLASEIGQYHLYTHPPLQLLLVLQHYPAFCRARLEEG